MVKYRIKEERTAGGTIKYTIQKKDFLFWKDNEIPDRGFCIKDTYLALQEAKNRIKELRNLEEDIKRWEKDSRIVEIKYHE